MFEVLAERDNASPEAGVAISLRCEAYDEAAARYAKRDWLGGAVAFERVCREWPEDGAARAMAERCAAFQRQDPGPDWDGVWTATSK